MIAICTVFLDRYSTLVRGVLIAFWCRSQRHDANQHELADNESIRARLTVKTDAIVPEPLASREFELRIKVHFMASRVASSHPFLSRCG
jgi:hypothetical protein